ncbi:MAG TPA: DUF3618 domain-containing protein [Kribbella sp.]
MTTTKNTAQPSETELLRADLELTRQRLAETVQELSRQLNVPRRIKESASSAGHRAVQAAGEVGQRAKQTAGGMGERAKQLPEHAKNLPEHAKNLQARAKSIPAIAKEVPALSRKHPKAAAAVGGAVALGAAAWIVGRHQ